ncbi:hypothetical protein [Lutibacter sp.]|uniref:hypothetical protein n=1 Tax=Lutibacter sp. TaxID=1925666 RepID=UPI0038CD9F09
MNKKRTKYKKSKTSIDMKRTTTSNSKNNINTPKGSKNNTSENNLEQQNNRYPSDIQGLFERLGIE